MDADRENPQTLKPTALTAADVARLLGVPVDVVQKHLAEGAPLAADGTMNLVHYAAWLNGKLADGD
jgi:plasmid maintenance system antidote protein VapI